MRFNLFTRSYSPPKIKSSNKDSKIVENIKKRSGEKTDRGHFHEGPYIKRTTSLPPGKYKADVRHFDVWIHLEDGETMRCLSSVTLIVAKCKSIEAK